jgi:hypothetical protein
MNAMVSTSNILNDPTAEILGKMYPLTDIAGWMLENNGAINNETLWVGMTRNFC